MRKTIIMIIGSAKKYILGKPQLYWDGDYVDWNDASLASVFDEASLEWIISHEAQVSEGADGSRTVSWFFIPGCEEDPESKDEPNWYNKDGYQCMGGFDMRITVSADNVAGRAELESLQ